MEHSYSLCIDSLTQSVKEGEKKDEMFPPERPLTVHLDDWWMKVRGPLGSSLPGFCPLRPNGMHLQWRQTRPGSIWRSCSLGHATETNFKTFCSRKRCSLFQFTLFHLIPRLGSFDAKWCQMPNELNPGNLPILRTEWRLLCRAGEGEGPFADVSM